MSEGHPRPGKTARLLAQQVARAPCSPVWDYPPQNAMLISR
eukprot:CAMPEP_0172198754 /NCGR_PEP_ID=MMETSP1050-20130122/28279_1 /TAXON_ID=233186 /ORGANISM="Cryptomonas curvata, Strain CCAP979/52" /LENGTH=40 /DNA_ID= /DNA_START= /DNA_END= /DNA_ORIENTATION=